MQKSNVRKYILNIQKTWNGKYFLNLNYKTYDSFHLAL